MSSDSDEDCYGNMAERLQKMKNDYMADKIESKNLLEDIINEKDGSTESAVANQGGSSTCNNQNEVAALNVPAVTNQRGRGRGRGRTPRGRRPRGNSSSSEPLNEVLSQNMPVPNVANQAGTSTCNNQNEVAALNVPAVTNQRGGGRGRGRTPRGRRPRGNSSSSEPLNEVLSQNMPVPAVANQAGTSTCNNQNEVAALNVPAVINQRGRGRGRGRTPRGRRPRGDSSSSEPLNEVLSKNMPVPAVANQAGTSTCNNQNEVAALNVPAVTNQRGGGRGRSRTPRGRRPRENSSITTYRVSNTNKYTDYSKFQSLFQTQTKKTDEEIVLDYDISLEENEDLSVKVYWQSWEIHKFSIRKYQKISQIFDYFGNKENVERDKLLFTYNDRILKPDDTPDSIGYSIAKFIDGGIVMQSLGQIAKKDDNITSGMKLKFQCQNVKKPFELSIRPDDKLSVAMLKCAEHLEMPLDRLRFEFDGDLILGRATANDLELEGGECIDVKILS